MMRVCSSSLLGIALIAMVSLMNGEEEEQEQLMAVFPERTIHLEWHIDWKSQAILFSVSTDSSFQWILIGFSDHGLLHRSDYCRFYSNGTMEDGWVNDELELITDRHQDCQLERKRNEKNDRDHPRYPSSFVFRRRFNTCDPKDYAIEIGTTQLLIAVSEGDQVDQVEHRLDSNHVRHRILFAQLLQADMDTQAESEAKTKSDAPSEIFEMKVNAEGVSVPSTMTTYWCVVAQLDHSLANRKHHLVKVSPLITKGNEHIVHHMELFLCPDDMTMEYEGNCDLMPNDARRCSRVLTAWAMGAGPFEYPPETGMPLGGSGRAPRILVEIHYNNVDLQSDLRDNSGFILSISRHLREHDAAILELGLIYSDANSIPPRQSAFIHSAFCLADCTALLPLEGINIFASQLHAHLTGRKLWTSHYRNGVRLGEINRDNHYSPHWQHIQSLAKTIRVLPGDVLMTNCIYDTQSRKNMTMGGYGIEDEMCVNYLYYYPASAIEVCKSAIDNDTLHLFFEQMGVTKSSTNITEKFRSIEWNRLNVDHLNELYSTSSLQMDCLDHDGQRFQDHPSNWHQMARPLIRSGPFEKARASECQSLNV